MRPSIPAQHKEHENIQQPQEVIIDSTDALVPVVALKNGYGAERNDCSLIPLRDIRALQE